MYNQIKEIQYIHETESYSAFKKNEILTFEAKWMQL